MAFPLAFLVFAVPFGRALVPALMQVTADITVTALKWTGVPVFRQGMLLSIPGGDFEVARACSGLNYLMTGVVLGTLYAYLTYTDWRKRVAFVAVTVAVLIVANGIRAYLTVAIAHWSDMRYGTGYDHIVFGPRPLPGGDPGSVLDRPALARSARDGRRVRAQRCRRARPASPAWRI